MEIPFKNLVLDYWYKMILVAFFTIFVLSGAGLLPNLPPVSTALISMGGFFIGTGEWINHPLQTRFEWGVKITSYRRLPCLLGTLFDLLGAVLIAVGVFKLF